MTFWDTANRYNSGSGNSERVIGRWFASNPDQRRNVIVATKLAGAMDGITPNHAGLSRANIVDSLHASLARLQLEYVDLLWFHRPDPTVPIEESLETVDDLVRDGTVRYFGISNVTVDELSAYLDASATISRRCRPIAVQNRFDPLNGEQEKFDGVLRFCAKHEIAYVPFSPLAGGLLTGRYLDRATVGTGDRLYDEGRFDVDAADPKLATVRQLAELAKSWDLEVSQVALAYLASLPGMGPQIPSSSAVAQLESNAAAGKIVLTEDQLAAIRSALSRQPTSDAGA